MHKEAPWIWRRENREVAKDIYIFTRRFAMERWRMKSGMEREEEKVEGKKGEK